MFSSKIITQTLAWRIFICVLDRASRKTDGFGNGLFADNGLCHSAPIRQSMPNAAFPAHLPRDAPVKLSLPWQISGSATLMWRPITFAHVGACFASYWTEYTIQNEQE